MNKRKERLYQAIIIFAVALGVAFGVVLSWLFLTPAVDVVACLNSGGAIVMQHIGPSVCLEKR